MSVDTDKWAQEVADEVNFGDNLRCPCCESDNISVPKDLNLHGFDECQDCGCLWLEENRKVSK